MIYTLGVTEAYERGLVEQAEQGLPLLKAGKYAVNGASYPGGSCWKTRAEAEEYIRTHGIADTHSVYGVEADWERDTEPAVEPEATWHNLLVDAPVVKLERAPGLEDLMRRDRSAEPAASKARDTIQPGRMIEHESGATHYHVALVPLKDLHSPDWNPRLVFKEDFQKLKESIKADPEMLVLRPVLAQTDGTIYAGSMRFQAVKELQNEGEDLGFGDGLIPAVLADVDEHVAMARSIRDNHHAGNDLEVQLAGILMGLDEAEGATDRLGSTVRSLGIRDEELLNILATVGAAVPVNPFTGERVEPETWQEPKEPDARFDVQLPDRADLRLKQTSGDQTDGEQDSDAESDAQGRSGASYMLSIITDDCDLRDTLAVEMVGRGLAITAARLEQQADGEGHVVDEEGHIEEVLKEHGFIAGQ